MAATAAPAKDHHLPPLLLALTAATGLVDAISYLAMGHVFVANMTGNVVFLGFGLVGAKGLSVAASLVALGAFLLGAVLGGRFGAAMHERRRRWLLTTTAAETVLVAAAAVSAGVGLLHASGPTRLVVITLLAVGLGIQNATVRRLAVPDLTTTVLTLTLTGVAADSRLAGGEDPRPVRRVMSVGAMLVGALVGGALVLNPGFVTALAVAAGVMVAMTVGFAVGER
jgi:uncharacterized membrane protein YoaK (UPF0700 family)